MEQMYLIIMDRNDFESTSFYTTSKVKVAEFLNVTMRKHRAWTFPQLKEITASEINLITE